MWLIALSPHWRAFNGQHLVGLVRVGAVFRKGELLKRPVGITPTKAGEPTETMKPETGHRGIGGNYLSTGNLDDIAESLSKQPLSDEDCSQVGNHRCLVGPRRDR